MIINQFYLAIDFRICLFLDAGQLTCLIKHYSSLQLANTLDASQIHFSRKDWNH